MRSATWKWVLGVGIALVAVAGCALGTAWVGSFLRRQGLDNADKIASIGGFFIGAAGLVMSAAGLVLAVIAVRRQSAAQPATPSSATLADTAASTFDADIDRLRTVTKVDHLRLFGVTKELAELAADLKSDSAWIISIWGGPGVGKTALAYELIKQHARSAGFRRVASVSAKFSHIDRVGHLEIDARRATIDWRDLLVDVAHQLAPDRTFNAALIEKQLPQALPAEPTLILVDNLETIQEAGVAVKYLATSGIIDPHKVILTTRESVDRLGGRELREKAWSGPSEAAARDYARYLSGRDLDPSEQDLDDVVAVAERTPLLIQIVVSQARVARLTVREVIDRLRDVGGVLGRDIWSFCYVHSLNVLASRVGEEATAGLMSVFCLRPAGSSFTSDDFFTFSGIGDRETFNQARAIACDLSLVRPTGGNSRFYVHSLLREFYCKASQDGPR